MTNQDKIKTALRDFIADIEVVANKQGIDFDDNIMRTVLKNTLADIQLIIWRYNVICPTNINESKVMGIFFYHFFVQHPIAGSARTEVPFWRNFIIEIMILNKTRALSLRPFFESLCFYLRARPLTPDSIYLVHNMLLDFICRPVK